MSTVTGTFKSTADLLGEVLAFESERARERERERQKRQTDRQTQRDRDRDREEKKEKKGWKKFTPCNIICRPAYTNRRPTTLN